MIKRRIRGLEGTDRIRVLRACLEELPGYYTGPYGQIRKWTLELIAQAETRKTVKHQDSFFLPRQGAAQVVLVGPPNAGKSSLLKALTGRQVEIGDYPFTTLRSVDGMVVFAGAKVQLIDLPGLIQGATDGKGGGGSVLAAIRMADAALHVVPLTSDGLSESLLVETELLGGGVDIPWALVGTKSDLEGAGARLAELGALHPGRRLVACSVATEDGLEQVRGLIWDLPGLIRVFCKPQGGMVSPDAIVLRSPASVAALTEALNRAWLSRVRAAHVTGDSTRFANQSVGLGHILEDGDVVELLLS